jgi:hypothetical protein
MKYVYLNKSVLSAKTRLRCVYLKLLEIKND